MEKFKILNVKKLIHLPKTAGVYCFKDKKGIVLYIGKAGNIRNRVKNHFSQPGYRDNFFINQVAKLGYIKTNSEIEALLLESQLIKKFQPKYNVLWKDDKNYFYVAITQEEFPRVFITHQPKRVSSILYPVSSIKRPKIQNTKYNIQNTEHIGPFVDGRSLKRTLDFLRKVFPYYVQSKQKHPKSYCLWCNLKLCPGPDPDKKEYRKNIRNLVSVLSGKRLSVLKKLRKGMKDLSEMKDYENAAKKRDQIAMLEKVISHSRVLEPQIEKLPKNENKYFLGRAEAYDISNIQGQEATGSMVVFTNGQPNKNQYRKFKIKIAGSPNDVAMIKEILSRRLKHPEWPYPDLMLIDGGKAQLNAGRQCLTSDVKHVKLMALAKRNNELFQENKKKPVLLKNLPPDFSNTILRMRNEAHRFAISYHKKLRHKALLKN